MNRMSKTAFALKYLVSSKKGVSAALVELGWKKGSSSIRKTDLLKAYGTMPWISGVLGKIKDEVATVPW